MCADACRSSTELKHKHHHSNTFTFTVSCTTSGGSGVDHAPVDHVTDGAEVMAHVQCADVAHVRQRQVELESLLTVTFDL